MNSQTKAVASKTYLVESIPIGLDDVTEKRINIGTSNMTWDYFQGTAGASFNTDHPDLVKSLNDAFDRDWSSSYAQTVI